MLRVAPLLQVLLAVAAVEVVAAGLPAP